MFEDENFVPTLFNAYRELQPPLSSKVKDQEKRKKNGKLVKRKDRLIMIIIAIIILKVMECLVLVASVRKALFSGDAERSKFVLNMMQGVRDIIFTGQGMNDTNNYNEFCRLLYRFRATAPLNEMAEKPGYVDWISLIADFSLKAVQSWKVKTNNSTKKEIFEVKFFILLYIISILVGTRNNTLFTWILVKNYSKYDTLSTIE